MKSFLIILISVVLFAFVSCKKDETVKGDAAKSTTNNNEKVGIETASEINDFTPQLPYELKEDGLYVYIDGPDKKERVDKFCFNYLQKNYKYIRIPSNRDKIVTEDGPKTYQNCKVWRSCESNLGKPSLYELGYERHEEREIKPEDNRFGRKKIVEKKWEDREKRLYEESNYDYILDKYFTQMSPDEFRKNGIVIIGKHISRVVIKTVEHMPKHRQKILVRYEKIRYDCNGNEIKKYQLEPKVVANFKRINFKENIFEFIEEEPLPKDARYLSDDEFTRLCENIHQFIPREFDKTIHTTHTYRPGYYLIEYYNGNVLCDYQCVKLGSKGNPPPSWNALSFDEPESIDEGFASEKPEKYVLILAQTKDIPSAEHYINKKAPYPLVILPFKKNGQYLVGRMYYNKKAAENEMKRFVNMGKKQESMQILPFN
ncbi:MAG: hypothetical protein V1779_10830 [bacterium]